MNGPILYAIRKVDPGGYYGDYRSPTPCWDGKAFTKAEWKGYSAREEAERDLEEAQRHSYMPVEVVEMRPR